ncbi:hypothetical protein CPC08DRAFT_90456 [Agrocybe pediades]|nr:hypothetical protein CPC08DRAFT_90456 [Agrocybe pediades]
MRPPSRAASHTGPDRTHSYNTRNASHSRVPSGRFPRPSRYEPNAPREIRLSPSINSPLGLGQNEPTTASSGLNAIATTPQNEGLVAHTPRDGRPLEGTHRHPRGSRHSSTRSVSQPQPERHTTATHSRPAPDRMVPFTSPREIPASTLTVIPENAGPEYSRSSSSSHRKAQPGYYPSQPLGNVGEGVGSFSQSGKGRIPKPLVNGPTPMPRKLPQVDRHWAKRQQGFLDKDK